MSHLQVSQENAVVRDTVTRRVKAVLGKATKGEVFDVKIPEFDEVYYNIKAEKNVPHVVTISLALPKGIPLPTVSPMTRLFSTLLCLSLRECFA